MIRKYTSEDIDRVIEIWAISAKITYNSISSSMIKSISRDLKKTYLPNSETWVYEYNNMVVGFISMLGNVVGGLVVHPEYQGVGIGKSLVEHIKSERGSISLNVLKENTKVFKFYEKCGFMPTKDSICPITGAATITVTA